MRLLLVLTLLVSLVAIGYAQDVHNTKWLAVTDDTIYMVEFYQPSISPYPVNCGEVRVCELGGLNRHYGRYCQYGQSLKINNEWAGVVNRDEILNTEGYRVVRKQGAGSVCGIGLH